mgnify:FL=1
MAKGNAKKSFLDYFKLNDSSDEDFDDDLFDEEEEDYEDDDFDNGVDSDYDDDDDYDEPSVTSKTKTSPLKSFSKYKSDNNQRIKSTSQSHSSSNASGRKLVSINGRAGRVSDDSEVFVIKPDEFDDAQMIIDHLNRGQIIVINMEDLDLPTAQRIADFIGGASYAVDGLFQAISGNIFLATPNGTYVSGDLREELAGGSIQGEPLTSKATY